MGEANRGSAQSHGWARKVYVIAVVICVRKMLIAKEARYAVSMVAKMTVSTLVRELLSLFYTLTSEKQKGTMCNKSNMFQT